MTRHLLNFKNFAIVLILVMTASVVNAQKTATADGPWELPATWSPVGVPAPSDNVTINAGIDVNVNSAAQCNSVTFASTSGSILVNSTFSLAVASSITLQNTAATNTAATITGAGSMTCVSLVVGGNVTAVTGNNLSNILTCSIANLTISGGISINGEDNGTAESNATLLFPTGTITVGGNIALDSDADGNNASAIFNMNTGVADGTLNLSAVTPISVTGIGTETVDFAGAAAENTTVNYTLAGAQTVFNGAIYRNLILSGSGAKTLTGVTVGQKISLQGTATAGTTFTYTTAILEYKGSVAQIVSLNEFPAATAGIDEVIIDNPNGVTIGAARTLNGDLTLTSGILAAGNFLTLGAAGPPLITRSEGSMTGTLQGTNDYDVTYTGNSKTTGPELALNGAAGVGVLNVIVNLTAGQTLTLDANRTPDGNVTISGGTFDLSTFTINRTAATGTFTINDGTTLKIGGTNSLPTNYNYTIGNTSGTIEYGGTAQTVAAIPGAETYTILILSGSGVKTMVAETVSVTLSMQGTATTLGVSPTYAAAATLEYAGTGTLTTGIEFPAVSGPTNLRMNGTNTVTLGSARSIGGALTLTNGIFVTTITNFLTINNLGTSSGGSTTSYVDGPLRKNGNQAFTFRVGKAGIYSPLTITAPDNAADAFRVEYRRESGTALGPINPAIAAQVFRVSNCEYWDLDELNDVAPATNISVTVGWFANSGCGSLPYINNVSVITLVHFDDVTTNTWNTFGGTPAGTTSIGTVIRTGVTVFSPFTLGTTGDNANPLPVNLVNVKAFEKNAGVQVEWTNLTETELAAYFVERSANGHDFITVAQVAPRANAGDRESYTGFDPAPLTGVSFYRIKAVEVNGKAVYSKSLKVVIGDNPKGIVLYPNPVIGNEVSISFSAPKGQYKMLVVNTAGQEVYTQQMNHTGGTISQTIVLPATIKSGVYNMLISGDNYKETKMFVVQ